MGKYINGYARYIYIYIHQMKTQRLYSCCSEKAMAIRYMDISLSYRTYNGNIMVPLSVSWEIYIYIYISWESPKGYNKTQRLKVVILSSNLVDELSY